MTHKKVIGIIGLGLIGGSIARALKRRNNYVIYACDKQETYLSLALKDGIIDKKCVIGELGTCDIVFICVPVYKMEPVLKELVPALKNGCILTDVGSTKGDVASIVSKLGLENRFIGGHPMAGSEKHGYEASKANLFENAFYCLTPFPKTRKQDIEILKAVISDMGAIPIEMTPEMHDKVTAAISHVPHVIAALLVNLVGKLDNQENLMKTIAAGGFKDITRIASSSPDLWAGICLSNKDTILETLTHFSEIFNQFIENLEKGQMDYLVEFFDSARKLRDNLPDGKSLIQKTYNITVDVEDKPGIIAVIATALAKENINIKNIGILNIRENEEGALRIEFEEDEARKNGLRVLGALGYKAREIE